MFLLSQLGPEGLKAELERARREESLGLESISQGQEGLASQIRHGGNYSRKAKAKAKLLVDAQQHKPLIEAHVAKNYDSPTIRNEILRHVDTGRNLQRQVTQRVAVAYSRPPSRTLKGIDPAQSAIFFQEYKKAKTDTLAEMWGRYAFFLSVVHVIPRYERGQLRWVTLTPDQCDVLIDHASGDSDPSILVYETQAHGACLVAVDSERWVWYSKDWKVINEETHGAGCAPWVAFRWQAPPVADYWDRGAGQDLLDATLEIGRVAAQMKWTRKNWAKKVMTLAKGTNVAMPENQNLSANQPIMGVGDGTFALEVHDTIVPVGEFLAEMTEITNSLLEAYGLYSSQETQSIEERRGVKSEALIKLRNQQVKHFDESEMEMAVRAAAVLRANGIVQLTEEEIRQSFRCQFAALTDSDTPKQRVDNAMALMSMNETNPVEFYMAENPGVTEAEALERVEENVRVRAQINGMLVAYNLSADPAEDAMTVSQLNGKAGGQASGVVRAEKPETPMTEAEEEKEEKDDV